MNYEQKELCAVLGFEGQLRLKITNEQGGATKWLNISEAQARQILAILGDTEKGASHAKN
jgi:hypothetical protein